MTIQVGERIPDVTVGIMTNNGPGVTQSSSLFYQKKVAVFGLPGAFTKTWNWCRIGFDAGASQCREPPIDC